LKRAQGRGWHSEGQRGGKWKKGRAWKAVAAFSELGWYSRYPPKSGALDQRAAIGGVQKIGESPDYEQVTRKIYETLGDKAGVKIVGYGSSFTVKGSSGVNHQIDVLTSHFDGIHQYLTDIECKHWDKKINKDILMKVKAIVEDCRFSKGVVVSKLGFTEDAIAYGKYENIGLVILREPTEEDWEGRIQTIVIKLHPHVAEIARFDHQVTEVYENRQGPIQVSEYHYQFPDGTRKEMSEVVQEFEKGLTFDKVGQTVESEVKFPAGTVLLDSENKRIAQVVGVNIAGVLKSGEIMTTEVNGRDKVWLFMKSIFEEKTFMISHEGEIHDVS
jgi:hypothetical protein